MRRASRRTRCCARPTSTRTSRPACANPLDEAILAAAPQPGIEPACDKLDEIPYDFVRKRLSVVVRGPGGATRAADHQGRARQRAGGLHARARRHGDGRPLDDASAVRRSRQRFAEWSAQGYRVLGVADAASCRAQRRYARSRRARHDLRRLPALLRPAQAGRRARRIADLAQLGVQVKIITGDNRLVARARGARPSACRSHGVLTGARDGRAARRGAVARRPSAPTLFAEVDPNQKERIILALQKIGPCGRLHGRRHQRRARAARRRRRHLGGPGGGRGQGGRRLRAAASTTWACCARGIEEGRAHLRQHAQVHLHHHQRQLRQHVQHGRRVAVPAVPAAAAPSRSC